MNYTELIAATAAKVEVTKKDAKSVIDAFVSVITESLVNGDDVKITGIGTFKSKEVAEREARNPQDGTSVVVPAHRAVKFTATKSLKDMVR